ncbi:hypothetical protein D9599_26880 [Roseomonas sp. KE2513]|nr:hypothetical protein [Roseomonas sp. KE2513]
MIWSAFTVRAHLWPRRDLAAIRERAPSVAVWPDGTERPSWRYSTDAICATGPSVGLNITTPVEGQIEWLLRRASDYLLTHPSMARLLADACFERGVHPARLKEVITRSEALRKGLGVPLTASAARARRATLRSSARSTRTTTCSQHAKFGLEYRADLAYLHHLPRTAAGKFENSFCEIVPPAQKSQTLARGAVLAERPSARLLSSSSR